MELKSFKGMPHELGGIDYTENSELEGGEFGIKIGKLGNEYIFDKGSPEGETLSNRFKQLDRNGRLTEDDPISLATIEQIAREESLKHAKRSVNEKGIDPFRNMYNTQMGANGGVKYAAGGAKDMYFTGGVAGGFNMSSLTDMKGGADGILGMTDLMGSMQGEHDSEIIQSPIDFASIFKSAEAQQQIDANAISNSGSLVSGIGGTIENLIAMNSKAGTVDQESQYRTSPDDITLSKKRIYHEPNAGDYAGSAIGGFSEGFLQGTGAGGPMVGLITGAVGAISKPIMQKLRADKMQEAADQEFLSNLAFSRNEELQKQQQMNVAVDVNSGRMTDQYPGLFASTGTSIAKQGGAMPKDKYFGSGSNGLWKKGGAKNIYGHYAHGGGKQLYGNGGGNELKIPENIIMSKDTEKTLRAQTPVSLGGDDLFVPYAKNNTCVAGVNCFEDIAGIRGIPDSNYNNTGVRNFMTSDEGKALFEQIPSDQAAPGDYVQFPSGNAYPYWGHIGVITGNDQYVGDGSYEEPVHNNTYRAKSTVDPNTYISMLGNVTGNPLLSSASFLPEGTIDLKAYYRLKNEEARNKVLQAAMEGQRSQKDVVRPVFGNEPIDGYMQVKNPNNPYRGLSSYPMAGF